MVLYDQYLTIRSAFSIESDLRRYTSSILQSHVPYFIDRKSVGNFIFPNLFRERPLAPSVPMKKDHYPVSGTTTTNRTSNPPVTPRQCVAICLQAIRSELLPNFCKGSSTLLPTEKAVRQQHMNVQALVDITFVIILTSHYYPKISFNYVSHNSTSFYNIQNQVSYQLFNDIFININTKTFQ